MFYNLENQAKFSKPTPKLDDDDDDDDDDDSDDELFLCYG